MSHIFISYSRKDAEFVDRLILALEQYGFRTWQDVNSIVGGEVWKASISKAVKECDAFLIVLSSHSASSPNVSKELAVAAKHQRRILPVLYMTCELSDKMDYDLAELQWVDFCEQSFDEALEQLIRALGGTPTAKLASTREVQALRDFIVSQAARFIGRTAPEPTRVQGASIQSAIVQAPALNFCIYCGARILAGNTFCTGCGRKVGA